MCGPHCTRAHMSAGLIRDVRDQLTRTSHVPAQRRRRVAGGCSACSCSCRSRQNRPCRRGISLILSAEEATVRRTKVRPRLRATSDGGRQHPIDNLRWPSRLSSFAVDSGGFRHLTIRRAMCRREACIFLSYHRVTYSFIFIMGYT